MAEPAYKPGEREATEILKSILGVPVDEVDVGGVTPGLHDLEIRWPEHPAWAVEVKMETDSLSRELLSALAQHGYAVETDLLRSRWLVGLLPGAPVKALRAELPGYLARVEAEGWSEFVRSFGLYSGAVQEVVQRFRVWHGKATGTDEQPRLVLVPPTPVGSWAWPVERVNGVVERWASRDDVRKKLMASGSRERHLFIWVAEDAADVAWTLERAEYPPSDPPSFPPEVTGAWIATGDVEDPVVWFVTPEGHWKVLQGHKQTWPGERKPEPPRPG